MATIYVPDDLKERLQNRASQLKFNIVEGSAGARASEMPEFLDYLLSLVTPPTSNNDSQEDNDIVKPIWDHCTWAVEEVVNVMAYELRNCNKVAIQTNLPYDAESDIMVSLVRKDDVSLTLIDEIYLGKQAHRLMMALFDVGENNEFRQLSPSYWQTANSPFRNPDLLERAAMFTADIGSIVDQQKRSKSAKFEIGKVIANATGINRMAQGLGRPIDLQFTTYTHLNLIRSADKLGGHIPQLPISSEDGNKIGEMVQYRRMLELVSGSSDPDDLFDVLYNTGLLLIRLNRSDEALAYLQKARQLKIEQLGFVEEIETNGRVTLTAARKDREHYSWWGHQETRDYMEACKIIGMETWRKGQFEYARNTFEHLLKLNPTDNQGIRYLYLAVVAEQNGVKLASGKKVKKLDTLAKRLIKRSKNKELVKQPAILYSEALLHFMYKDERQASDSLREAFKENPHVPLVFFSAPVRKQFEAEMPITDFFTQRGAVTEAESYYRYAIGAWRNTPGALAWLLESAQKSRSLPQDCQPPQNPDLLVNYENPMGYLAIHNQYGGIKEIYPDYEVLGKMLWDEWDETYPDLSPMMTFIQILVNDLVNDLLMEIEE